MKQLLLSMYLLITITAFAQEKPKGKDAMPKIDKYWFVMIKTGPRTDYDSLKRQELFKGHMTNMDRLHKEGVLKVAGPFGKNDFQWRGIFILDCATLEEARQYTDTDPAVAAGLFVVDIVPWYTEASGNFKHGKPEKE
jgi:uncharacterized protein YciI